MVIAGAGITGVTTALMLQERGLKCAIAEARNMGFGTTGGTTAHLNNFFDTSYDKVINDFGLDKGRLLADAARDAPYRSYAMALKLRNGAYPRTLGYDMLEAYHYYRTHEVDGEEYLIVGGEDHKTGDVENSDDCFRILEEYVSRYFDIERVAYKWSSQYYEPADGLPYIGPLPGNPSNVYCATGYSGNGMIFGTLAAKTLSGLIADGDSPYKELFSPSRVKPVAAFSQMVKENVDVIKHLVVDSFTVEKLNALADLERDEGKLNL